MRAMLVLVVAMGVLIVAGVATVAVTIVGRMGAGTMGANRMGGGGMGHAAAWAETVLDQPAGTRIVSATMLDNRLVLVLQGGGPDRVIAITPQAETDRLVRLSR